MSGNKPPKEVRVYPFLAAMKGPDGKIVVHLNPDEIASPAAAGILLVDLARHYARMFVQTGRAKSEGSSMPNGRLRPT